MKLHGEIVNLYDRVYDISPKKGHGEVVRVTENLIEVKFLSSRRVFAYDKDGMSIGENEVSLFWHRPLIIIPKKSESDWIKKQTLINGIFTLIENYKLT